MTDRFSWLQSIHLRVLIDDRVSLLEGKIENKKKSKPQTGKYIQNRGSLSVVQV